jgi:hypothetical protein
VALIVKADESAWELVSYTGKTGSSITGCVRQFDGSSPNSWLAGDLVYFGVITSAHHEALRDGLIAVETLLGANGSGFDAMQSTGTLTIAAGVLTLPTINPNVAVILATADTEAAAASDDLDSISIPDTGAGTVLILKSATATRNVAVQHSAGALRLAGNLDCTLDLSTDRLLLQYHGAGEWVEVTRSLGAGWTVSENGFFIADAADPTKLGRFDCSSIPTGTTNTYVFPSAAGTLALTASTQPLDADLTTLAANITAAGHALVDDADAAAQRTTLGLVAAGAGDIWVEKAGDTMTGPLVLAAGTASAGTHPKLTAGTVLTTPEAGAVEYDGTAVYTTLDTTTGRLHTPNQTLFRLTANGANIGATIADFFGTNSSLSLPAGGIYRFVAECYFTKNTAGTILWTLLASSAPTMMSIGMIGPGAQASANMAVVTTGATTAATAATVSLSTAITFLHVIYGIIETNAATNIRLRATQSAGTVTPLRGSNYTVRRLPSGNVGNYVA